jgi:DNA-binding transcriptional LysR family regulator
MFNLLIARRVVRSIAEPCLACTLELPSLLRFHKLHPNVNVLAVAIDAATLAAGNIDVGFAPIRESLTGVVNRSKPQIVIHRNNDLLRRPQIPFRSLDGRVPQAGI